MEITFKVLNNFIDVANEHLKSGNWNDNNVIAYFGVHGIKSAGSHNLIERVQNYIATDYINNEYAQSMDSDVIEAYSDVNNDFITNKDKFTLWKGGSYWDSDLKLHQFVDSIMHLMFLGITKSTHLLI